MNESQAFELAKTYAAERLRYVEKIADSTIKREEFLNIFSDAFKEAFEHFTNQSYK